MYLFKYYRPDFFLEKTIRYNELYFSARAQLNDPNDLNIEYRFDNKLIYWELLLRKLCDKSYSDLSDLLDLNNPNIRKGLNRIFRGAKIKSSLDQLDNLFDSHIDEIRKVLHDGMLPIDKIDPAVYGSNPDPQQFLVTLCENSLKERLYSKIVPAAFSVSFSSNALDRMMWAHYAAGFSGSVVIYETQSFKHGGQHNIGMKVRDNIFSVHQFFFPVKPVIYNNRAKEVSLLDPRSNTTELFLTKNKFWKYESEYRMYIPEMNAGIGNERSIRGLINRNVGHIFHHETHAIKGVIFGPRMSGLEKEKIWTNIKSNMENSSSRTCYFFDAELSPSGRITISRGQHAKKTYGFDLFRADLSQRNLTKILKVFGIAK